MFSESTSFKRSTIGGKQDDIFDRVAFGKNISDRTFSDETISDKIDFDRTVSDKIDFDRTVSDKIDYDRTVSHELVSSNSLYVTNKLSQASFMVSVF